MGLILSTINIFSTYCIRKNVIKKNSTSAMAVYKRKADTLVNKSKNRKTTTVKIAERKKTTCFDESLFIITYLKPHKSRK